MLHIVLELMLVVTSFFLQVSALSFGDFYDTQYVKMYSIFIVQLQVVKIILLVLYDRSCCKLDNIRYVDS